MSLHERDPFLDVLRRLEALERKTIGITRTPPRTDFNGGDCRITPGLADTENDPSATDGKIYFAEANGARQAVFDFDTCSFKPAGKAPPRTGLITEGISAVGTRISSTAPIEGD